MSRCYGVSDTIEQTQQSGYKDVRRSFQVVLYLIELSQSLRGQDHLSQSNFVTI
jgi:hypothetical protein